MQEDIEMETESAAAEERIRQYAEIVVAIVERLEGTENQASLTAPQSRATVSAGPEVEPQTHLTTQYDK